VVGRPGAAWGGLGRLGAAWGWAPRGSGGLGRSGASPCGSLGLRVSNHHVAAWGVPLGAAGELRVSDDIVAAWGIWSRAPPKNGLHEDCKAGGDRLDATGWRRQAGRYRLEATEWRLQVGGYRLECLTSHALELQGARQISVGQ